MPIAAALGGAAPPRLVDEDLAHGARGDRHEVRAALRLDGCTRRELEPQLVHQGGGMQRAGAELTAQLASGEAPQVVALQVAQDGVARENRFPVLLREGHARLPTDSGRETGGRFGMQQVGRASRRGRRRLPRLGRRLLTWVRRQVVESVLVINPGYLSKRRGPGTYAKMSLYPPKSTDGDGDARGMVSHKVFSRARVEITRI